jgi:predicted ATPase
MALTETISHLNRGLELISTVPQSRKRDESELSLRVLLGTAWMALKGWAAQEVWTSYHPAHALAKSLKRNDALLPILSGLAQNVMCQGRVAESMQWVEEMLGAAKTTGDSDLLIAAHVRACNSYFFLGKPLEALQHGEKVLALYDSEKHRHHADILNHDPKTLCGVFSAESTWELGYPDQAVRRFDNAVANARQRGHPFDLGFALSRAGSVFDYSGEFERITKCAEELERVGREHSLPALFAFMAPVGYGYALIRKGEFSEGVAKLKAGLAIWDASGGKVWSPAGKALLAEGMAMNGDLDNALQLIDEQIEQIERPGWEERQCYAEILRIKGRILTLKDDPEGAEKNYLASLDCARDQQTKSWELRTSTSLARLWQSQGKNKEAHDLLAPVYDWFTEGFDTKDLKEAKALLEGLR